MANKEWLTMFPSAQTLSLPFEGFDHQPLVTNICGSIEKKLHQFRYDKCLFDKKGFKD